MHRGVGGIVGGANNYIKDNWCYIGGGDNNDVAGNNGARYSVIIGGKDNNISGTGMYKGGVGGLNNSITSASAQSVFIGGTGNVVSHNRSVILGGSSQTTSYDDEVLVPNLTISNYASLNYADDVSAAAGGIVLGQVYHNNGDLRIRIT